MKRRGIVLAVAGFAVVIAAGVLVASNMGFKLNYAMDLGSVQGANTLALPYNQQIGINTAADLITDIDTNHGSPVTASVSEYGKATDSFVPYTGFSGPNFTITPGVGYLVKVSAPTNYIIVGSHNPGLPVTFDLTSVQGANFFSYPYHATAADAAGLLTDIGGSVASVSEYGKATDSFVPYTGFSGPNFTLIPGSAYLVKVGAVESYTPSHY